MHKYDKVDEGTIRVAVGWGVGFLVLPHSANGRHICCILAPFQHLNDLLGVPDRICGCNQCSGERLVMREFMAMSFDRVIRELPRCE